MVLWASTMTWNGWYHAVEQHSWDTQEAVIHKLRGGNVTDFTTNSVVRTPRSAARWYRLACLSELWIWCPLWREAVTGSSQGEVKIKCLQICWNCDEQLAELNITWNPRKSAVCSQWWMLTLMLYDTTSLHTRIWVNFPANCCNIKSRPRSTLAGLHLEWFHSCGLRNHNKPLEFKCHHHSRDVFGL